MFHELMLCLMANIKQNEEAMKIMEMRMLIDTTMDISIICSLLPLMVQFCSHGCGEANLCQLSDSAL